MSRELKSPYPANAVFGVRVGFRKGVYSEYREFLAQTTDYSAGKEVWAVFTNHQHADEYVNTGGCPVPPLAEKKAQGAAPTPSSARSLPTPDTSPETENLPTALPTRQRPAVSAPLTTSASQPPPAPRKRIQPDSDDGGDTEPEDDIRLPSASLPISGARPLQKTPSRPPGYIADALRRHASGASASGIQPSTQTPALNKPTAPTSSKPIPPTAPVVSSSAPSRPTHHPPPTASGSGLKVAPASALAPIATPALVPELPRQPRPHGTYHQCHHCDGKGWILTPAQPGNVITPSRPPVTQTPGRPRAAPATNLKIVSTSDSDTASGSATHKTRTPSGSGLRLSSIGGAGPERTPKRDPRRVVSDTVAARRSRITSDGVRDKGKGKGKGKGKERAIEPMDIDPTDSEAGHSTYNYM